MTFTMFQGCRLQSFCRYYYKSGYHHVTQVQAPTLGHNDKIQTSTNTSKYSSNSGKSSNRVCDFHGSKDDRIPINKFVDMMIARRTHATMYRLDIRVSS